jgi:Lon protease-like protein
VQVDWKGIDEAPNEALVNALCMMSPFGPREKQALLEAGRTLKTAPRCGRHHRNELARPRGSEPTQQ